METVAIIINSKAHQAKKFQNYFKLLNAVTRCEVFQIHAGKLHETLEQCKKDFKFILVGGGDGTIRTAAQHLINTDISLGVLPLGTLNHFAQENNLPITPEEIVNALHAGTIQAVDTAEVNGNVFINNASLGFYPGLVQKRNYYAKFVNKWLAYVPSLLLHFKNFKRLRITLCYEQKKIVFDTSFLLVSNNIYSMDFPSILKRENIKDGILGLYYNIAEEQYSTYNSPKSQLLTIDKTNSIINVSSSKNTITLALDGEVMKLKPPLIYKSQPKSLKLLVKA